jgi:hypothetical protein
VRVNREVNLPERLFTAQREGQLVVFAGAGVSVDDPSNLPLFDELAVRIAAGGHSRQDAESVDAFLGRIARDVNVDRRARDILDVATTKPCALHRQIVKLFTTPERLRVVTTNFDRHLTTTAHEEFGAGVDVFNAPALPLGRSFSGIVYVHGSVARREPLVLTDVEFGRAYLVDGWASRFLTEMFTSFTVLFVGYSHTDPVMRYLARAFFGKTERFALVPPGNDDHWRQLGIVAVHYPLRGAPAPHAALGEALEAWTGLAKMGVLDHEQRIKEITAGGPPIDPDVADYMEWVIRDIVTLRLFCKHATAIEWLRWVDEKGALAELYSGVEQPTEKSGVLAEWIASKFAIGQPNETIQLIAKHDLKVNWRLWQALAMELARSDPKPTVECLEEWVPLLCATFQRWGTTALGWILQQRGGELSKNTLLLLFRTLVTVRAKVDRFWLGTAEAASPLSYDVQVVAETHDLRKAWTERVQPRFGELHGELLGIVSGALLDAHLYSKSGSGREWERLSSGRASVEPHGQDAYPEGWEFLVDAARDLFDWLLREHPTQANATIEAWLASDSTLLQRLGIYGLVKQGGDADELLRRIESNHWLFDPPGKHEVFALVANAFPRASKDAQRKFVEYAATEPHPADERAKKEPELLRSIEYERYNVAVWLAQVAPDSDIAKEHLAASQKEHKDFSPREHPDFGAWSYGVHSVSPKSPLSVDEILARPPADLIKFAQEYEPKSEGFDEPDRSGFLTFLREAVTRNFAWSKELADELLKREDFDADLWPAVLSGWKMAELNAAKWRDILNLLSDSPLLARHPRDVVDLIEKAVEDNSTLPFEMLGDVERILDTAVANADGKMALVIQGRTEWLTQAINHPGGRAALAWVKALSKRRVAADSPWERLPTDYRKRFERVGSEEGTTYQLARVAIASQVQFLFSIDAEWTTENVIPWFDWEQDELRAEQAWHGFAVWGRWSNALAAAMMGSIRKTFSRIDPALDEVSDQLLGRLAGLAVYSSIDPWHGGWLMDFIRDADDESRSKWCMNVGRELGSLTDEQLNAVWDKWLREYWRDRLTGVPKQFSDEEKAEIIGWAVGVRFDEAVDLIVQAGGPANMDEFSLYRLKDGNWAATHPRATALLVRHIARSFRRMGYSCSWMGELALLALDNGAPREVVHDIAEAMAKHGCNNAATVAERSKPPKKGQK